MERVPSWVWGLGAAIFAGLAIWTATDENWSGVIVSVVLGVLCLVALFRRPRPI
jgi:hypothetical protein